jgi:light-regulated signal transduction histidine kinase (bacteriophytochrome)
MRAKLKEQAERLEKMNRELARSNAELQQFAYIASHDLREPLRKMASFADLLVMRCVSLDGSAKQYARFIVDGASRLQTMIEDLLEYSRAGRPDKPAQRCESADIVAKALSDLSISLAESKAEIKREGLPAVWGDFDQLTRLFQNLIGNALKFRGENPTRIELGAEEVGQDWRFHVRDNGIGIDPAYHEKIFGVFNRLHARELYPGTGVGLAICRKIVEHHGGRIWVESRQGQGAAFYFTLPRRGDE